MSLYALPLSPSPSPSTANQAYTPISTQHTMFISILLALFVPCIGLSIVFVVYMCVMWTSTNNNQTDLRLPEKPVEEKGLSALELEQLPKVTGKELVMETDCVVCLDEIKSEQPVRLIPVCNHGFHLECADTWLSKHTVCPVCRANLDPHFFNASDDNPC